MNGAPLNIVTGAFGFSGRHKGISFWVLRANSTRNLALIAFKAVPDSSPPSASESHAVPAKARIHWSDNGSPRSRGRR